MPVPDFQEKKHKTYIPGSFIHSFIPPYLVEGWRLGWQQVKIGPDFSIPLSSVPWLFQFTEFLILSWRASNPAKEPHFYCVYCWLSILNETKSFAGNWEPALPPQTMTVYNSAATDLIHLSVMFTFYIAPEYDKALSLPPGVRSLPSPKSFQGENHCPSLFPATSHSAGKHLGVCHSSTVNCANRTSLANNRNVAGVLISCLWKPWTGVETCQTPIIDGSNLCQKWGHNSQCICTETRLHKEYPVPYTQIHYTSVVPPTI